jgi:cell division protein FtsN
MEATTKRSSINGENWYRVVIGPFDRKVEADRAMTKLREKNLAAILLKETKTN